MMRRIAVIATRTRIHACHKHEATRVGHCVFGPRNGNSPVLQGLPQHFQRVLVELRKLIREQHSVMSERYFARHRSHSATHEGHFGYRMMRAAERSLCDQSRIFLQFSSNGVDLRGLQALVERQRRKNGRQSLRHHTLSASRWANHDDVVRTSGCHFEGPFDALLPTNICKIQVADILTVVKFLSRIYEQGSGA